jgi:hypothetical protein
MPITFTVDHARRLVVVIATGAVTRETVVRYFETQRMLEGLSYPRLVEIRALDSQISRDEWRAATEWLRTVTKNVALGPAAVVVDDGPTFELVRMIAILVSDFCEVEGFFDRESAEDWLADRLTDSASVPREDAGP